MQGFCAAANRDVGLTCTDYTRRVTYRLYTRGTSRHRRADRAFEPVADGNVSGGEIR
jgi:hypothetical protein